MPSAVSVPLKPLFGCDNQCSEKPLSSGSWLLWWLMKEMKHIRPTCVRSVSTNTSRQTEKNRCQMCSGGRWWKEGVSRKDVDNYGERNIIAWQVGILSPRKQQSKEVPRAGRRRKAGRNTRSLAAMTPP